MRQSRREGPKAEPLPGVFHGIQFGHDGDTSPLADKFTGRCKLPDFQQRVECRPLPLAVPSAVAFLPEEVVCALVTGL